MSRGFGSTFGAGTTDVVAIQSITTSSIISLSEWFYMNATNSGGGSAGCLFYSGAGTSNGIFIGLNGSTSSMKTVPFANASSSYTWAAPSSSAWHHILFTWAAGNIPIVYIDGASVAVTSGNGIMTGNTGECGIGNEAPNASTRNWDGMIAHAALWNNVILGPKEALALYSGINPIFIYPDSLKFYLPLDGVSNPEFDFINGNSIGITGTKLGTSDPPIRPLAALQNVLRSTSELDKSPFTPPAIGGYDWPYFPIIIGECSFPSAFIVDFGHVPYGTAPLPPTPPAALSAGGPPIWKLDKNNYDRAYLHEHRMKLLSDKLKKDEEDALAIMLMLD